MFPQVYGTKQYGVGVARGIIGVIHYYPSNIDIGLLRDELYPVKVNTGLTRISDTNAIKPNIGLTRIQNSTFNSNVGIYNTIDYLMDINTGLLRTSLSPMKIIVGMSRFYPMDIGVSVLGVIRNYDMGINVGLLNVYDYPTLVKSGLIRTTENLLSINGGFIKTEEFLKEITVGISTSNNYLTKIEVDATSVTRLYPLYISVFTWSRQDGSTAIWVQKDGEVGFWIVKSGNSADWGND